MRSMLKTFLAAVLFALACSTAAADEQVVIVNGVRLPSTAVVALQLAYRTIIPSGRYWYDPASGLWGREGEPLAGQMHAGLQIGGSLKEDACNAGFEGGPPLVSLAQARARGAQGYAGWNNNTAFGNWGGDGNCSYYNNPDGDSIMIGDC
jgi:hypothetical protein